MVSQNREPLCVYKVVDGRTEIRRTLIDYKIHLDHFNFKAKMWNSVVDCMIIGIKHIPRIEN